MNTARIIWNKEGLPYSHPKMLRFFSRQPNASREKQALLRQRWSSLPKELKTTHQLAGKTAIACGATHHVMEKCNFSCTCCYLGPEANKTKPLPFSEVKAQLDTMRAELGVAGKVQITAGEVTLLPLAQLGRIVSYAIEIGLDPMVMSHGQRFLEEPDYLISLVRDYGLRKISIHIDTTQRGRKGTHRDMSERDLHPVRDEFAKLIRYVRAETGHPLQAASTVTLTESNLSEVENITQWFFKNSDSFRLLSFLPVADVGRTRKTQGSVEREGLWEQINGACKQPINRTPLQFGHRKCNNLVPLLLVNIGEETIILEGVRAGNSSDERMLSRAIDTIGSQINWGLSWRKNLLPFSSTLLKNPLFLLQTLNYTVYRIWSERSKITQISQAVLQSKKAPSLHPFLFIIHNFMSPGDLLTKEGKERLDACIFKVPVDGKLISMCEMNAAGIRAKLDRRQLATTSKKPELSAAR